MPDPTDHPVPDPQPVDPSEVFARAGGVPAFEALVDAFYERVEHDELLRPMYPDDLEPGKRRLALFLAQYFGGGDVYGRERGHPRLRRRHSPFPITPEAAQHWARHMTAAIQERSFPPEVEAALLDYVVRATPTLVNQFPDQDRVLPGGLRVLPAGGSAPGAGGHDGRGGHHPGGHGGPAGP